MNETLRNAIKQTLPQVRMIRAEVYRRALRSRLNQVFGPCSPEKRLAIMRVLYNVNDHDPS